MNPYIRTFQHDRRFHGSRVIVIDFSKIHWVEKYEEPSMVEKNATVQKMRISFGLCDMFLSGDDCLVFLEAFAEYARDMQSLERGPVSFKPMVVPEFSKPKAPDETH